MDEERRDYVLALAKIGQSTLVGKLVCLWVTGHGRHDLSAGERRRAELLAGPVPV